MKPGYLEMLLMLYKVFQRKVKRIIEIFKGFSFNLAVIKFVQI